MYSSFSNYACHCKQVSQNMLLSFRVVLQWHGLLYLFHKGHTDPAEARTLNTLTWNCIIRCAVSRRACVCSQSWAPEPRGGTWSEICGLAGGSCLCPRGCWCGFPCMLCRMWQPTGMSPTSSNLRDGARSAFLLLRITDVIPPHSADCR